MRLLTLASEAGACRGCVLVPTMGALHDGHFGLVRAARAMAEREGLRGVAVTIFVNPTQFNDPADLARYPRTLEADAAGCATAGADIVFAPGPDQVYPPGEPVPVPPLPDVATRPGLEDAARPGHFAGVCQVVSRLFDLTSPAAAIFGEKDWQQLAVIRAMTFAQGRPVRIVPSPTARDADGLAMSSRNAFLTPADRPAARALWAALRAARREPSPAAAQEAMRRTLLDAGIDGSRIEYAVVRDAATLMPIDAAATPEPARPMRALIAARVGSVRLIDNDAWSPASVTA
jgi:pantoate--beta-alanine ligase